MTERTSRSTSPATRRAAVLALLLALGMLAGTGPIADAQPPTDRPRDGREVPEPDQERPDQEQPDQEQPDQEQPDQEQEPSATGRDDDRDRSRGRVGNQQDDPPTINQQPAPIGLGTAGSFAVLAGSAVTNTGPTVVSGDLGVSPGTSVTGFPPGVVVNGTIHVADAVAAQAQADLTTAYNDAAGRACDVDLTGQDLGGLTLTAGVYCFSSSAQLTGTLTLDAQGDPGAVFIFQIGSTLTTASGSSVNLINGASPCNVFWQVGSSATLGTTTSFVGTIMALTSITANTDATVEGRLLARNGAVTLDSNVITLPDCEPPPPPGEATITIVKETDPDDPQNFEFTGDLGTFVLDDDLTSATPRQLIFTVEPGSFTVTESVVAGFDLESITCTGGVTTVNLVQRQVVIEVVDGDQVTCVFVNLLAVAPPPPPPPPPPPDGEGPGGPPDGEGPGGPPIDGLAVTGVALGGLLTLTFFLLSTSGGLLYAGRHRAGRAGGRHRPGAARAWVAATAVAVPAKDVLASPAPAAVPPTG